MFVNSPRVVTKIVQPSQSRLLLHRARLVDFLQQRIHAKLVILSAPAGYGKTTLLIDFARETNLPICWYQLDASDRDPQVFLEYLAASIHRRFPAVGDRADAVLGCGTSAGDWNTVIGALVTEIQERILDPFMIVLDDYHLVADSPAINHILDTLLLLLPEKAHLVLSSRTLPTGLALTRLAVRQQLVALGPNDLRFTAEEIRSLFYQHSRTSLSLEQAAEVAKGSEGWIAGVLLTTPTLSDGLLQRLASTQTREALYEFLANETFVHLPVQIQTFLLHSAVLNRLDAAVCNAVLQVDNSADMLRHIEDLNLFLVREDETDRPIYRYHTLFQEFLRHRLAGTDPALWQQLNRRAAEFCEHDAEYHDQAIGHYMSAGLPTEAARVIQTLAQPMLDAGHWSTLAGWIDALPIDLLDMRAQLVVTRAIAYAEMGQPDRAEQTYSQALALYKARGDALGMARTSVWRAMLLRLRGDYPQAVEVCRQALNTLRAHGALAEQARAWRILGSTHVLLGEFPSCIRELEQSLQLYQELGDELRVAWLQHDIGTALRHYGDSSADAHFRQALEYWERTGNSVGMALTLNSIGVGYHQDGYLSRAIEVLEEARSLASRMGNRRSEAFALASLGDVYRDRGDHSHALDLYRQAADLGRNYDGFVYSYALTAFGETYRLAGAIEQAAEYLSQALEAAQAHQSNYEIGLARTGLGILQEMQSQTECAIVHLKQAIEWLKTAPRDEARARVHLAAVYFGIDKREKAKHQLRALAARNAPIQPTSIPFLVADRTLLLPVLRFAVDEDLGSGYFRPALEKATDTSALVGQTLQQTGPRILVRALGPLYIAVGDRVPTRREWGSHWVSELFVLALHHSDGLLKEDVLEAFWSHKPAAQAIASFHNACYRLRRVIPGGLPYEDGRYTLSPELTVDYDVWQFTRLIRRARASHQNGERMEDYRAAVALYRGDFFPECYSDWCSEIRDDLRRQYLDALLTLAQATETPEPGQAAQYYRTFIEKEPDREDVYRALMRLQYRMGDRTGAIKTYEQCATVLREELNVPKPSRETVELYERIITEDC